MGVCLPKSLVHSVILTRSKIPYQSPFATLTLGQILGILHHHVGRDFGLLCSCNQFQRRGCGKVLLGRIRSGRDAGLCSLHESMVYQERAGRANGFLVLLQRVGGCARRLRSISNILHRRWGQIFGGFVAYGIAVGTRLHGAALAGWKIVFLVNGLLTASLGVVFWFVMPDNQLNARWLNQRDRVLAIERVRSNQQGIGNKHFKFYQLKEALLDPLAWAITLYALVA
jgi:hypothetical protein